MKGLIDYPSDWMSLAAQKQYDRLKWRGAHYNNLIRRTSGGYWYDGELTYYYEESLHGPLWPCRCNYRCMSWIVAYTCVRMTR